MTFSDHRLTRFISLTFLVSFPFLLWAQRPRDLQALQSRADSLSGEFRIRKAEAVRVALEKGWPVREELEGRRLIEIRELAPNGRPVYFITDNINAAATTSTARLWPGGSAGMTLTGAGYTIAEWDGGGVLLTHQEFNNGGQCRVTQVDGPIASHYHSTHVAGTLIAEGESASAHGMAHMASLHAYDWNYDDAEMTAANTNNGINLSNHSYGYVRGWQDGSPPYWFGDTTVSTTEDYEFGFYDYLTAIWDDLAYDMPDYLIVKSAGNDRGASGSGQHRVWDNTLGNWVLSTSPREKDGGTDGYDCLGNRSVCKNILTVGAVNDIAGGYTQPSDVVMTIFSCWGPTDDGRIKPDIVANGISLYSCYNTGNNSYTSMSGTSMSSPNACGSLGLLQDYAFDLLGAYLYADALKALIINTAYEAGTDPGPDYKFGWGLLNASGMANLITLQDSEGGHVFNDSLANGSQDNSIYYCSGGSPVNVTIAWTDPPGTSPDPELNPTDLMLVHDLDLRIIRLSDNTTYNPWVLDPANPTAAATMGDNYRDNVERVTLSSPAEGYYKVRISHDGTLTADQWYGLAVSGMRPGIAGKWTGRVSTDWNNMANWDSYAVPNLNIDVVIPAGCTNYPVLNGDLGVGYSTGVNYFCKSVTIDPGAEIIIND